MARIIKEVKELSSLFIKFCSEYDNISFVTAWAGMADDINRVLFRNKDKINHSVVGLHFYQTDPEFIRKFYGVTEIHYYKHFNKEIFHPKAYLFYDDNQKRWAAIIGSSNLTRGGFVNNNECNVLLTSESDNEDIFISLSEFIESMKKSYSMDGKMTTPAKVFKIDDYTCKVILYEGIYHQIRRLVKISSNLVIELKRSRIGNYLLGNMAPNELIEFKP